MHFIDVKLMILPKKKKVLCYFNIKESKKSKTRQFQFDNLI